MFHSVSKSERNAVSPIRQWKACKVLADFNTDANNEFLITNYQKAHARD